MPAALLAMISNAAASLFHFLWDPIASTPWTDWRGFWLGDVFDDRYVVCYFLPLVPILLLFSRRHLRIGIILTGLTFLAYICGVLYALLWLVTCVVFYRLSERFVIETKRTDVLQFGPPLAAGMIIAGWFLATQTFQHIHLPDGWNLWLHQHAPWIFPLGVRGFPWEPLFVHLHDGLGVKKPPQLFTAMFWDAHYIGTAYFTVRMLHYFAELKRDAIPRERRSLLNFLAYVCYGPALLQGPIERYPEFQDELDTCHERRSWRNVAPALARIAWGIFKGFVGIWYFKPIMWYRLGLGHANLYYEHPEQIESCALLYFGVYLQIFWLYLEFSGYCDVTAGIARLLGYRQVENFNWCWLATSLRDFWRRWHISLSLILRDYIYIALGGNRRHVTFNLCLTFFVCGLWHRVIPQVAIWGIVMGLMLAVNQGWARWMKRLDETPSGWLPALRRSVRRLRPLPQILSWALTMHCFVMSLLIFFGGSGAIRVGWELIRRPLVWLTGWPL